MALIPNLYLTLLNIINKWLLKLIKYFWIVILYPLYFVIYSKSKDITVELEIFCIARKLNIWIFGLFFQFYPKDDYRNARFLESPKLVRIWYSYFIFSKFL